MVLFTVEIQQTPPFFNCSWLDKYQIIFGTNLDNATFNNTLELLFNHYRQEQESNALFTLEYLLLTNSGKL